MRATRGLVFDGFGTLGLRGLQFNSGSALHIQNCVFRNYEAAAPDGIAILFTPNGRSQLFISDSIVLNNGSIANTGGIKIVPRTASGSVDFVFDRVHVENNVEGLLIDSTSATSALGVHGVIRDSVFAGNAANGIRAVTAAGKPPAFAFVEGSSMVNNAGSGILTNGPGATVLLGRSVITRNGTGVTTVNGGQLISYADNKNNNNVGAEGTATGFPGGF